MTDQATLGAWDEATQAASPITTEMLDQLGQAYKKAWDAKEAYDKAGKVLSEAANDAENALIEAMTQAGKDKYIVEGVGTFGFVDKMSVTTPKTNEDKQKLAEYLEQKGGKVLFWSMFGINSNTLQTFYRGEFEEYQEAIEKGAVDKEVAFGIPGLDAPTNRRGLRLYSERKK